MRLTRTRRLDEGEFQLSMSSTEFLILTGLVSWAVQKGVRSELAHSLIDLANSLCDGAPAFEAAQQALREHEAQLPLVIAGPGGDFYQSWPDAGALGLAAPVPDPVAI